MFNIGDKVVVKGNKCCGKVIEIINKKSYLVKFETSRHIYYENELVPFIPVSKTETVPKFKIGDNVVYGETHTMGTIRGLMQNNGKNTYHIFNTLTGEGIVCSEEDVKSLTFKDQKGNVVKRSEKLTISNTDYSIKLDKDKPQLHLVPISQLWGAIAQVREYGVSKYGDNDSWKQVEIKRYHDALLRHTAAITMDLNSIDEESGLPHRWHIACNLAFIEAIMEER